MLPTLLFTVPFLLSAVTAFTFPNNQADGVYHASIDARGNEIHRLVAPVTERGDTLVSELNMRDDHLSKRSVGDTWCGCGFGVDHQNTDDAVADLKNQLGDDGQYLLGAQAYYSVRGSVVAFACNLDADATLLVWTDIITQSAGQITSACGLYVAGTAGGLYSYAFGYMQYSNGLDFCTNALGSPANHC
jgi:hypothetical protein